MIKRRLYAKENNMRDQIDMNNEKNMIEEKTAEEFRNSGLLWFINTILHMFGWAICFDLEKNMIYPARCKFRGFNEDNNREGYRKVTQYLLNNIKKLDKESKE